MGHDEAVALEIAIIDLVTAIQEDRTMLSNEIEAVSDAAKHMPKWSIEVREQDE